MKSEAKANQDMQTRAEAMQYEREQWAKALAAPKVSHPVPVVMKKSFFSWLFGV